jgi:hypothetical protein
MSFTSESIRGPRNPRWRGGRTLTAQGYVRLKSGPWRYWLEHRAVVARNLADNTISPGVMPREIPDGWEVHHMDFNRRHNCSHNLLLLHPAFHEHARHPSNGNGKYAEDDLPEEWYEGAYPCPSIPSE